MNLQTTRSEPPAGFRQGCAVNIGHDDRRAIFGHGFSHREAESPGSASYESDLNISLTCIESSSADTFQLVPIAWSSYRPTPACRSVQPNPARNAFNSAMNADGFSIATM